MVGVVFMGECRFDNRGGPGSTTVNLEEQEWSARTKTSNVDGHHDGLFAGVVTTTTVFPTLNVG